VRFDHLLISTNIFAEMRTAQGVPCHEIQEKRTTRKRPRYMVKMQFSTPDLAREGAWLDAEK
jgi:hypothetical protein